MTNTRSVEFSQNNLECKLQHIIWKDIDSVSYEEIRSCIDDGAKVNENHLVQYVTRLSLYNKEERINFDPEIVKILIGNLLAHQIPICLNKRGFYGETVAESIAKYGSNNKELQGVLKEYRHQEAPNPTMHSNKAFAVMGRQDCIARS